MCQKRNLSECAPAQSLALPRGRRRRRRRRRGGDNGRRWCASNPHRAISLRVRLSLVTLFSIKRSISRALHRYSNYIYRFILTLSKGLRDINTPADQIYSTYVPQVQHLLCWSYDADLGGRKGGGGGSEGVSEGGRV